MLLLIADDLTGSCDSGIHFVKHGMDAFVAFTPASLKNAALPPVEGGILAINAASRNIAAQAAAKSTKELVESFMASPAGKPELFFKKMDSTLRGNPGAEIDAIMEAGGLQTAFIAPAFPKQGRTVRDGLLLVNGQPLHETAFAKDPLTPMRQSSISAILGARKAKASALVSLKDMEAGKDVLAEKVDRLAAGGASHIIFDTSDFRHLLLVAETGLKMSPRPLFAGSAGLAEALAACLGPRAEDRAPRTGWNRILLVCGSANQRAHEQLAVLAQAGIPVLRMPKNFQSEPEVLKSMAAKANALLAGGRAAIAAPLERLGEPGCLDAGMAVNAALGALALDILARRGPAAAKDMALAMTGGETALAILERLGDYMKLEAELSSGIVLGSLLGGEWDGLRLVTKAGGFGGPRALLDIMEISGAKKLS